jgi:hypothetical protein
MVVLYSASSVWQSTTPESRSKPALRTSRVVAQRELPCATLAAVLRRRADARATTATPRSAARVDIALAFRKTTGNWRPYRLLHPSQAQGG